MSAEGGVIRADHDDTLRSRARVRPGLTPKVVRCACCLTFGQASGRRHGGRKARGAGFSGASRPPRRSNKCGAQALAGWSDPNTTVCAARSAWCLGRRQAGAMGGRKARGSGSPAASSPFKWVLGIREWTLAFYGNTVIVTGGLASSRPFRSTPRAVKVCLPGSSDHSVRAVAGWLLNVAMT